VKSPKTRRGANGQDSRVTKDAFRGHTGVGPIVGSYYISACSTLIALTMASNARLEFEMILEIFNAPSADSGVDQLTVHNSKRTEVTNQTWLMRTSKHPVQA
jgi:hypothetical protein